VALVGALLVVFVLMVRPQEFVAPLQSFSLLNLVSVIATAGVVAEIALARQRFPWTPQLPWLGAFVGWCFLVTVRRVGVAGLPTAWSFVGLSTIFMLVALSAAASLLRFRVLAGSLVVIGFALACTCIDQSRRQPQCIAIDTSSEEGERSGEGAPDGRSCDSAYACEAQGQPRTVYACERVGLFGTFTEGMRVRWRGTLGDPNELALALGAILPFAFAFFAESRRADRRWLVAGATLTVVAASLWCVALTGSRGGQLVVLTVLAIYFARRYGVRGAWLAAIVAVPVLLFGGRTGEEAESSSLERLDLLYEGMDIIRSYPVLGVGVGQFVEHVYTGMTAHNSYVLAAAELGLPGSLLWLMLLYVSIKIPVVVAVRPPPGLRAAFRPYALALAVAFAGVLVGVFFLSFCYKAILFVYLGLSGALYRAVRSECPAFDVSVSPKEVVRVALADVGVLAFVLVYSHVQGART
jgi:hypothetical protein